MNSHNPSFIFTKMCFLQKLVAGNVIANRDMSLIPLLKKQFENEFIVLFYRKQTSEWRQFEWIFLFQQFLASLSLGCLLKNRWNFVFFLPIYKFYNAQLVKIGWDFKWIWLLPKETSHVFISISSSLGRRERISQKSSVMKFAVKFLLSTPQPFIFASSFTN